MLVVKPIENVQAIVGFIETSYDSMFQPQTTATQVTQIQYVGISELVIRKHWLRTYYVFPTYTALVEHNLIKHMSHEKKPYYFPLVILVGYCRDPYFMVNEIIPI